jgi:hypothetical protein
MSFNPNAGTLSNSSDVALSNPTDNQLMGYDNGTGKWTNQTPDISAVNGLQTELDNKQAAGAYAAASHAHAASDISDSTSTGRSVLTAASATAARSAIGAGTSNLALGTTSSTAKAGNYSPTKSDVGLSNVDNTSDANKPVSNATAAALAGKQDSTVSINAQTGTSYTLVLTDASKLITLSNSSAVTLTVPPNSSVAFPIGSRIVVSQFGEGQVSMAAGAGVTLRSDPGLKIAARYGAAELIKVATNEWLVVGRLSA